MKSKPKRIVIQFECTAKEKRAIKAAAKAAGVSLSEWLRRRDNGRELWGLATPRGLPILYGDKSLAEEDADTDERVALFRVWEVTQ